MEELLNRTDYLVELKPPKKTLLVGTKKDGWAKKAFQGMTDSKMILFFDVIPNKTYPIMLEFLGGILSRKGHSICGIKKEPGF